LSLDGLPIRLGLSSLDGCNQAGRGEKEEIIELLVLGVDGDTHFEDERIKMLSESCKRLVTLCAHNLISLWDIAVGRTAR
jgi:hypothetical protein